MAGLKIDIKGDASHFEKAMGRVEGGIKTVGANLAKFGAIGAAAMAGAAVGATFLALKINAIGEEARASDARLKNTVKQMGLFGQEADNVAERLLALADATARQTGLDDDAIALVQTKLSTFKSLAETADEVGGAFDRATIAAIDMSAVFGGDASQYAVQLGKALEDPEKGLAALKKTGALARIDIERIGAEFLKTGDKGKAFDNILSAIEKQVGGAAKATAKSSEKIKVSIGQIVESFAKPFSAAFDNVPGMMESVFPAISAKAEEMGKLIGNALAETFEGDTERIAAIGVLIGETLGKAVSAGFAAASTGTLDTIIGAWQDFTNKNRKMVGLDPKQKTGGTGLGAYEMGSRAAEIAREQGGKYQDIVLSNRAAIEAKELHSAGITSTQAAYDPFISKEILKQLEKIERKTSPLKY